MKNVKSQKKRVTVQPPTILPTLNTCKGSLDLDLIVYNRLDGCLAVSYQFLQNYLLSQKTCAVLGRRVHYVIFTREKRRQLWVPQTVRKLVICILQFCIVKPRRTRTGLDRRRQGGRREGAGRARNEFEYPAFVLCATFCETQFCLWP